MIAAGVIDILLRPRFVPCRRTPRKKELHGHALELVGISGQSHRIAMRVFNVYLIALKMVTISMGNYQNISSMPKRSHCFQTMICDMVSPNMHTIISGYWEGPDTEDGWGYIEAVVFRSP
ncbi:uncharacterized protein LOC122037556 isoform X1 [Zingiber officinale]|uniref:uncharacterized protein LOC122037556 isoform X1 n=1 Tax=Zingiber officinale TaxID=94328 RepID=UPI001C4CA39E|nr:uncharacterized protein LOC122037556 isoform X1 [Zingiber officinale]